MREIVKQIFLNTRTRLASKKLNIRTSDYCMDNCVNSLFSAGNSNTLRPSKIQIFKNRSPIPTRWDREDTQSWSTVQYMWNNLFKYFYLWTGKHLRVFLIIFLRLGKPNQRVITELESLLLHTGLIPRESTMLSTCSMSLARKTLRQTGQFPVLPPIISRTSAEQSNN